MNEIKLSILDHGYAEVVTFWGSDEAIVEAARMSTGKGFLGWGVEDKCARCGGKGVCGPWGDCSDAREDDPQSQCVRCEGTGKTVNTPGDEKLLRFLYENRHMSPFEMGGATFEVQAPIFVFREWHRHRTQSYNEASARYAPLPDVNYVPSVERLMLGGGHLTKQAGTVAGAQVLTEAGAEAYRKFLAVTYAKAEDFYQEALAAGVPKELARVHLPVGRYSKMRASANLRNWLQFLTLRTAPNAQWEIRQYALAVECLLKTAFPRTMALFAGAKL